MSKTRTFLLVMLLLALAAMSVNTVTADCLNEVYSYECHTVEEEAQNLICSECEPDGEDGHYNCSCWIDPAAINDTEEEDVYLNCQDAYMRGANESGVYTLKPDALPSFKAYCDMETDGGGWTVFQRRMDGSVDFYLDWSNYVLGFGNVIAEYWLGLSKLYRLTNGMSAQLRVDLESFSNQTKYAIYDRFYIGRKSSDYYIIVRGYHGNAGDGMSHTNGMRFTTKDNDNDEYSSQCGQHHHSGWWHNHCTYANLNGYYYTSGVTNQYGIFWYQWLRHQSLKSTVMMLRTFSD